MKPILPLISAFVIFFSAIIILFTPFRPQLSFVTPELKLIGTPTPSSEQWQTYTFFDLGIQFDLPSNWQKQDTTEMDSISFRDPQNEENSFIVSNNNLNKITLPLKPWVEKNTRTVCDHPGCGGISNPIYNGTDNIGGKITEIYTQGWFTGSDTNHILKYRNKIYQITFGSSNEDQKIIQIDEKIKSSIKFLPDTSTWKTYTSQQYGFKIKYPKNYVYTPCTSLCTGDGLSPPLDRTRTDDYYFDMIISGAGKLPKNTDFNTWMDKKIEDTFYEDAITNDVVTTVNNYLTRKITFNIENSEDFYYITDNNSVIEIRVGANKTNSEIENNISQILSTFKFTP